MIARWLLYLLILAFPFFSIEPEIFRPDWWVGALLIAAFGLGVLLKGRLRLDPVGKAALGLHVAVFLSVTVNFWGWKEPQWAEFFTLWLQLLFATLLYLALANLKLSQGQLRSLLRLWVFVAVVVALYGLYQVLARNLGWQLAYLPYLHPSPERLPSGLGFGGYVRPSSFLREPTYLGTYLLAPLFIVGVPLFYRQDRAWFFRSRWMNLTSFIGMLTAWIATFAMAAYLTLAVIFLIALMQDRRVRRPILRMGVVLIMSAALIGIFFKWVELPFVNAVVERGARIVATAFGSEGVGFDASAQARLQEVILSLQVWVHHPLFGIGLNQLQFGGEPYIPRDWPPYLRVGNMHNIWLEVLVQVGILGFVFFGLLWLQGVRMMLRAFKQGKDPLRVIALSLFYILLATMIRGLMGGPFTSTLYWFYLGLASLVYRLYRREHEALAAGQH